MRNYTEEIRAQHDGKIYREVITFTDLDKNGNKIIVELLRGRRGKAEYIAVDVTRLDGEGVYTGAIDLNPQVERQERNINGVKCVKVNITWCGLGADRWEHGGLTACSKEFILQFAKTAPLMDSTHFNFFRGIEESGEIIDLYNIRYIF